MPLISTASPTFSERIFSSVKGRERDVILVEPFFNSACVAQSCSLATIGPTHIADTHKIRGGQPIGGGDFHAEQGCFSAETHRTNSEFVGRVEDVLLKFVQFGIWVAVAKRAEELLF